MLFLKNIEMAINVILHKRMVMFIDVKNFFINKLNYFTDQKAFLALKYSF